MDNCLYKNPEISKTVQNVGLHGRKPTLGWKCLVKIKVNGVIPSEFNSDYVDAETIEITIGDGDWPLDKAIESCLETMYVKETSTFLIKFEENTKFSIDIFLDCCKERDYIFNWSNEEKLEASKLYKNHGVELFKNDRIPQAFFKFSKALKMLLLMERDFSDVTWNEEDQKLIISLYNNLANCQYHFKNYVYVIELCTKSLNVCPNVKAFFRRALAYIEHEEYDNAENDLLGLLKIEPKNKAALEKYKLVRLLDKKNRENYELVVKNMFKGLGSCS